MKQIILIILLVFLSSCGYTSVYKNIDNRNIDITVSEMRGDRELNNLIKKQLELYSNKNSINKFDLVIVSSFNKNILSRNSSGVATDYELVATFMFEIYFNEETKKVTFNESINVKNNADSFEQISYEKNIKNNFASSVREKLILKILNINDN